MLAVVHRVLLHNARNIDRGVCLRGVGHEHNIGIHIKNLVTVLSPGACSEWRYMRLTMRHRHAQALQIEIRGIALNDTQPDIPVIRPGPGAVVDNTPVLKLGLVGLDIYGLLALAEDHGILQAKDVPDHNLPCRAIPPGEGRNMSQTLASAEVRDMRYTL